ncbi:HD domain-containing phosphohydrolase [Woodsholea maritima]|uniref:HD domain-containing phosphohydrolase n=1 Tax=Woodsholea maritima TaxID=240237 RepID=UPI00037B45AF|nr:HD domain-containing phosphohydrolase [Woodsholea maritima]
MTRKPKVLFVDDDPNVLNAIKRVLRKDLDLRTADKAHAGLAILRTDPDIDVVVTDQRMPEMDGASFLTHAVRIAPQTMRIMLTGTHNLAVATQAVNEGHVFKFINKPSSPKEIMAAIEEAYAERERLVHERDLLEQTVAGAVRVMMDVLAISSPGAFRRARRVQRWAEELGARLDLSAQSNLSMASILWGLGEMTLPSEIIKKRNQGEALTPLEQDLVAQSAQTAHDLVANIPHIFDVAKIILYSRKHYDGSGYPKDDVAGGNIPELSRLLHILLYAVDHSEGGGRHVGLLALLPKEDEPHYFDPALLARVRAALRAADYGAQAKVWIEREVPLSRLLHGDRLARDCHTRDGRLLLAAGNEITQPMLEKMRQVHKLAGIEEPIHILREELTNAKVT